MTDYTGTVKDFIEREMVRPKSGITISPSDSLIENGIVDSLGVQILIAYLEREFGIKIADQEIVPENLETLELIARFLDRKLGSVVN